MIKPVSSIYHIVKLRTGRELVGHELFEKVGLNCYTPFIERYQKAKTKDRKTRAPRKPYADPLIGGWLFVGFDSYDHHHKLDKLIREKDWLYSILSRGDEPIQIMGQDIVIWQKRLTELKQSGAKYKKLDPLGYDSKKHARKNKQRIYGKAEEVPIFTSGEKAKFLEGPFEGITFCISRADDESVDLIAKMFNGEHLIKGVDPVELKKVA